MTDESLPETKVGELLRATRTATRERVASSTLDNGIARLRAWQSARLAHTYADLLETRRYEGACRFFLREVYAARDFSQRDHDVTRMYHATRPLLPASMSRALELVIDLNALTAALDERLSCVLAREPGRELDEEGYVAAYRLCDNYGDRRRQIELILDVGAEIDTLVQRPGIAIALKLARVPAFLAGWGELQSFFERGFAAFKEMNGAREFLDVIGSRERAILDRIFDGAAAPFDVAESVR